MRMLELLRNTADVRALGKEQLGFYILEWLNEEQHTSARQGYGSYKQHEQNFLRSIQESYGDADTVDAFSSAWKWLIQEDHIAVVPGNSDIGWYRLTTKGRQIKSHDQWQPSGVDRDLPPGPAPNFGAVVPHAALAAHLRVLWGEADLAYIVVLRNHSKRLTSPIFSERDHSGGLRILSQHQGAALQD
jgi:hypothetical protein